MKAGTKPIDKRWPIGPKAILAVILLIAFGIAAEYIEQGLFQDSFRPSADSFPSPISNWDANLFLWINNGLADSYLGLFFSILTRLGSTEFVLIASVLLYLTGRRKEGTLLLASAIIGTLITLPLKLAIPRPRPFVTIPAAIALGREAGSSFPSGHTMRAFASAYISSNLSPKVSILAYLLAGLVGFSRVYLGQHYPSDVLAGAAIGLLSGYLTLHYRNKIMRTAVLPGMARPGRPTGSS